MPLTKSQAVSGLRVYGALYTGVNSGRMNQRWSDDIAFIETLD